MKKFLFRMETLLKVRTAREGGLKRNLEHTTQKWNQIKEREKMLLAQISALMDEMHTKRQEGKLDLQETYTQILDHLNSSLIQVQQSLMAQERQMEEHKEQLKQGILERKVIEKIKEKHYAGWRTQQVKIEGALLDEISYQKSADSN